MLRLRNAGESLEARQAECAALLARIDGRGNAVQGLAASAPGRPAGPPGPDRRVAGSGRIGGRR